METKLSEGSVNRILMGEKVNRPLLQIVLYKAMNQNQNQMKYRFQMTDGIDSCSNFIVVLPELIQRISKGEFEKFTVVQLESYTITNQPQMDRQVKT